MTTKMMQVEHNLEPGTLENRWIVVCRKCKKRIIATILSHIDNWLMENELVDKHSWHKIDGKWYCKECSDVTVIMLGLDDEDGKDEDIHCSE